MDLSDLHEENEELLQLTGGAPLNPTSPDDEDIVPHKVCYLNTCPEATEIRLPASINDLAKDIYVVNIGGVIYHYLARDFNTGVLGQKWMKYERCRDTVQDTFKKYTPLTGYMFFVIDDVPQLYYVRPHLAPSEEAIFRQIKIPMNVEPQPIDLPPEFQFYLNSHLPFKEVAVPLAEAKAVGLVKRIDGFLNIAKRFAAFKCVFAFNAIESLKIGRTARVVLKYAKQQEPVKSFYGALRIESSMNFFAGDDKNMYHILATPELLPKTSWSTFVKQKNKNWEGFETVSVAANLDRSEFHAVLGILHYLSNANKIISRSKPEDKLKFVKKHAGFRVSSYSGFLPEDDALKQLLATEILSLSGDGSLVRDFFISSCQISRMGYITTPLRCLPIIRLKKTGILMKYRRTVYSTSVHIHYEKKLGVAVLMQFIPNTVTDDNWSKDEPECTSTDPIEKVTDIVDPDANPQYFYRIFREKKFYVDNVYMPFRPRIYLVPMGGKPGWRRRHRYR